MRSIPHVFGWGLRMALLPLRLRRLCFPPSFAFLRLCSDISAEVEVDYDYGDAAYSFARRTRPMLPNKQQTIVLRPPEKQSFDFSVLQNCLVVVDKPIASLTFDLIDRARLSMGARHYRIGHTGGLDVMASGLVILLFGDGTKQMQRYDTLEREYKGVFRIGHITKTFDILSPIVASWPWRDVTDTQVEREVQRMVGERLQLCPPDFLGKATNKDALCHLRQISGTNKNPRPFYVKEFEVKRDVDVPSEFEFRVVCDTKLSVNCLIHELGESLGCGAHVRQSKRIRLGGFTLHDAWDVDELMDTISHMRRMAYLKNFDLYDRMKHAYWRPIGARTNKQKKKIKRRWESEKKHEREIREGKREGVMTALCY